MHLVWIAARLRLIMLLCALVQCKLYSKHKINKQVMSFKYEEAEIMSLIDARHRSRLTLGGQ